MERMNVKLHDVISDVTGVSGLKVVRAILQGERNPERLLALCDRQIQLRKGDKVRESLRGTWRAEHLFALGQALQGWEFYQRCIEECDQKIAEALRDQVGPPDRLPPGTPGKTGGLNTPEIDGLHRMLVRLCGDRDPTQLPGVADYSLLRLISETGTDLSRWPTEKHFTAWTGLAPGAKQSGKRHGQQKRHRNRAGELFCTMARSLAKSVDKGLGGFYRRLRSRRGGLVANKALARKIAAMFWRIMVHGAHYVERGLADYENRVKATEQSFLVKLAKRHGMTLVTNTSIEVVPG